MQLVQLLVGTHVAASKGAYFALVEQDRRRRLGHLFLIQPFSRQIGTG